MNYVAFSPKGILAPINLLAVMVPLGELTRKDWNEALCDRVQKLAWQEPDPFQAAADACRLLDCPICEEPNQLGQFIIKNNLNFQTWINASIVEEDAFNVHVVEGEVGALKAIESTTLYEWLSMAKHLMTGSSLENFIKAELNTESEDEGHISPATRDKELQPYIEFINKNLSAQCDCELLDSDSCEVSFIIYDFSFRLFHKDGYVQISLNAFPKKSKKYMSLEKLNRQTALFNESRKSKISFEFEEEITWYLQRRCKPSFFLLAFSERLTANLIDVKETMLALYSDIQFFFNLFNDELIIPSCRIDRDFGFFSHLDDEVGYLISFEKIKGLT